jgi:hypothetical protein
MATNFTPADKAQIVAAIQALSSVCDGAQSLDRVGFSGTDTKRGKWLARKDPSLWEPYEIFWAHGAIQKYIKQLAGFGIDPTTIAEPPYAAYPDWQTRQADYRARLAARHGTPAASAQRPQRVIETAGNTYRISLNGLGTPDWQNALAAVKALPQRRFDGQTKTWEVPVACSAAVALFANQFGYTIR